MQKALSSAVILGTFAALVSTPVLAQRPTAGGFGSVLYPGTGSAPNARPGYNGGAGIGRAPGGFRNAAPPSVRHPQHPRTVIVPYPVFYGGYYGGYQQEAPPAPAYPPDYYERGQQQSPPPVIIINQNFRPEIVNPQIRDYSNVPLPATTMPQQQPEPQPVAAPVDDSPSYYLIAMTDHKIIAAVTYWVEGDTLHFVTMQGDRDRVSLSLVNREFSKQLNADRRIAFKLPEK